MDPNWVRAKKKDVWVIRELMKQMDKQLPIGVTGLLIITFLIEAAIYCKCHQGHKNRRKEKKQVP